MKKNNLVAKAQNLISVPPAKVWHALTDPQQIKEYMFGTTVISDWKKGSNITWKGEMKGKKYEDRGKILEIILNEKLSYSHYSPLSNEHPINWRTTIR